MRQCRIRSPCCIYACFVVYARRFIGSHGTSA
jgi:hypothetical protein